MSRLTSLMAHQTALRSCERCKTVIPPVICGPPVLSPILLMGQAPGVHEGKVGRPFGWTAGKTLFSWFQSLGVDEETFRARVYITAVLRCFPGKAPGGGDRVPAPDEIAACRPWIAQEVAVLRPKLVIAVGRLAMEQVWGTKITSLDKMVGGISPGVLHGQPVDRLALPHPSGVSAWPKVEPGRTLLQRALTALGEHPVWQEVFKA